MQIMQINLRCTRSLRNVFVVYVNRDNAQMKFRMLSETVIYVSIVVKVSRFGRQLLVAAHFVRRHMNGDQKRMAIYRAPNDLTGWVTRPH